MVNDDSSVDDNLSHSLNNIDNDSHVIESSSSARKKEHQVETEELLKTLGFMRTSFVSLLRSIVVIVLLVSAIVGSVLLHSYARGNEESNFQTHFLVSARKIVEGFIETIDRQLGSVDSLSIVITSQAIATGSQFPNVTLPHFAVRGASDRILSKGIEIQWHPLVTDEMRPGWEAYAKENNGWYDEAYEQEETLRTMQDQEFGLTVSDADTTDARISDDLHSDQYVDVIHSIDRATGVVPEPKGSGPYFPIWQWSPVTRKRSSINFNVLSVSSFRDAFLSVLGCQKPIFGKILELREPNGEKKGFVTLMYERFLRSGQFRESVASFNADPVTYLLYPVFDKFGGPNVTKTLAGILKVNMYWSLYFSNILPQNSDGIICVMENTMNQTFTYQIDGPVVTFLGPGDRHDPRYNHMEVTTGITSLLRENSGPANRSYTFVDLDEQFCQYSLRLYPSKKMEEKYFTLQPVLLVIMVASIFLFTSLVFVVYDALVKHRQTILFDRAVASGAIVSSLFPQTVRDRLFEESAPANNDTSKGGNYLRGSNTKRASFWKAVEQPEDGVGPSLTKDINNPVMTEIESTSDDKTSMTKELPVVPSQSSSSSPSPSPSRPIADLFAATTVLFADLAGFTAWSATKEPTQVFELLETLYGALDDIADRRDVFKVETVGDCYVAVTGCPNPQDNHAVIMIKFARDCMVQTKKIMTAKLQFRLGEGTSDLEMRVGCHSGPVTAGVLRGRNSRFQLFGDTMNTASRMESNGRKGRIHVSKQTADELIGKGKGHWVIPRDDAVLVKGKGEMQTFWAHIKSVGSGV